MYYMTFSNTVFTSNKVITKIDLISYFGFFLFVSEFSKTKAERTGHPKQENKSR